MNFSPQGLFALLLRGFQSVLLAIHEIWATVQIIISSLIEIIRRLEALERQQLQTYHDLSEVSSKLDRMSDRGDWSPSPYSNDGQSWADWMDRTDTDD